MLPPTSERVGPCSGGLHTDQVYCVLGMSTVVDGGLVSLYQTWTSCYRTDNTHRPRLQVTSCNGWDCMQVARIRRRPCALSSRQRAISPVALQPSSSSMQLPAAQQKALLFRAVELLFKFPPFFAFAAAQVTITGLSLGLHTCAIVTAPAEQCVPGTVQTCPQDGRCSRCCDMSYRHAARYRSEART